MENSRRRPPPVAAKPLHSRSKSMPERSNLERQNSVEDDDSQSYRSGSSGDPMSPTTYDEFVKSKGMMQEDQEVWMSMAGAATAVTAVQRSLDSWKSRRRRATHSVLERKASREEVEQTEQTRQRRRSKTYSEMMEEKEKREKILMTMATKNKTLEAEDIVHILTKPSLYEDEIKDLPERDDVQVVYRNGDAMLRTSFSSEVYSAMAPGSAETMTFKEKLLRDREREIGMTAEQRNSKSSARLPQKKRLSLGIMGRVAAFNKGEGAFEEEHKPKTQTPREEKRVPEHCELTIEMEQKPRNENGFGFTIIGGSDSQRPIVVTSITKGSSADTCEMMVGDEIVAINGEKTKTFDYDHAMYCFSSAIITGDLTLKIHRYEEPGLRKYASSSTRNTGSTDRSKYPKRRAVSQPADPRALTQAARAKKILQQMREDEQKIEDMRREREEASMRPSVNGNQNWNHRESNLDPVRSYYNDPKPQEQPESQVAPSGPAAPTAPEPSAAAPLKYTPAPEAATTDEHQSPFTKDEIKMEVKEVKQVEKSDFLSSLERLSPDGEQYGKPVQVGIEILDDESMTKEISSDRDSISPDGGFELDEASKQTDDKYPVGESYGSHVDVGVEILDEIVGKTDVEQEHSVNLSKLLVNDRVEKPESDRRVNDTFNAELTGPDGVSSKGSSVEREAPNKSSRPENYGAIESDGEMFSSEEDERMEADIMDRIEQEQKAEEDAAARHRHIEEDEKIKDFVQEVHITPQSKPIEEAPIGLKHLHLEESAPPISKGPSPFQHHTAVDGSKPQTYQPVKFGVPKPFQRLGPEPYRPPTFKPVVMREKDIREQAKQDMIKRRSDFFNDEKDHNNRSGQSSPIVGISASAEESAPQPIAHQPVESSEVQRPQPKQPVSLSSRKTFNVDEEKKRLERWHAEQDRIRQEQYEQEQRRLREQQEKDLERVEAEERKRKVKEHQRLLEKQKVLQEQAAEERKRLEEERKERMKKEGEFLERAKLEREAAEKERLKDEEEQRQMAAERMKREDEKRKKDEEDRKMKEAEKKAEEEEQRQREKEEWKQQELERQDQEAEARRLEINRIHEKEKVERLKRKKEEETRMAREHEDKERERFARLREEEIERIRKEERERLRQEWDELQREKTKQEERERLELERLEQLRAEQELLRQERILLEQQQEKERHQLQKEKERLMMQSTAHKKPQGSIKPPSEEIPYHKPDKKPDNDSKVLNKESKLQEYDNSVVENEIIISQENKDVFSAPPPKSIPADSYDVPGQAYLSQYKDGKMGSQHWLVEEAERRRLAEKNGTMRLQDPIVTHTGPIQRKDLDLEPVLEKKSHAPVHVAPVRRTDKPAPIQEPANSKPPSRQQPKPQKETRNQGYREVAVDVPSDFHGVQRRLRAPEAEAERKKKTQNRRSMPDMGNRVPDVVRKDSHTPPPAASDRNIDRMPDNFLQQPQLGPPGRTSAFQQPSKKPAPGRSVSGKVTCSNCAKTLGRGAAMIIESLGLHYHIECFRCCVCHIQLGNGTQGTDVRIRASKLHCQNCYSNDAGFEFTEV